MPAYLLSDDGLTALVLPWFVSSRGFCTYPPNEVDEISTAAEAVSVFSQNPIIVELSFGLLSCVLETAVLNEHARS